MHAWQLDQFGVHHLRQVELPTPTPAAGEVRLRVRAISLNYRDLLILRGEYNPRLRLPAIPVSDGAAVVDAIGDGVKRVAVGDIVVGQFVSGWIDGPFQGDYLRTTLGTPGPGMAAEYAILPEQACVRPPEGYSPEECATLPIAALTAWSALVTEGDVRPGQSVLTLGTGGVSVFAIQIATALGARVIVTSSSDAKLARARELGAHDGINYRANPAWEQEVLRRTDGRGVDLVVETVGAATLDASIRCTRAGGVIALLGALQGMRGEITAGAVLMKRLRIQGVMVDSRRAFEDLVAFVSQRRIRPVIDRVFEFSQLPDALACMERGEHFGKIVLRVS